MYDIITKNEAISILGLDYDFDPETLNMYILEASNYVISKTDYNLDVLEYLKEEEKETAKILAKNIARRYLIEAYFKTTTDHKRDMTLGLVSAVLDLQLLIKKAHKAKANE